MAVHKRGYRGYSGRLTPLWSRFLIVTRYAFRNVFQSKFLTAFFVCCFFYPLGCAIAIDVNQNLQALSLVNMQALFSVDGRFFFHCLNVQFAMAFILTALAGPGLVSSDLVNNALPLYFCRPFSRADYVLGKMAVLIVLLSLITWVPGLALFLIQSALVGVGWMTANVWIAGSIVVVSSIDMLVLCLLSLALSAWIRRKVAAGAALLGVFFFAAGFGRAINAVLSTRSGSLLNIGELMRSVAMGLFRVRSEPPIPSDLAWLALLAICIFCLMLLERKVRAYEVVRG